jgi:hypothetical protein
MAVGGAVVGIAENFRTAPNQLREVSWVPLAVVIGVLAIALKQKLITHRQGFVEPETFEKIVANLTADLADAARFAYFVGWRQGAKLRWEHVDRTSRLMIVPGKLTRSRKPQTIALEGELWAIIERRWLRREVRRKRSPVSLSPCVFHRGDGKPIGDFRNKCGGAKNSTSASRP